MKEVTKAEFKDAYFRLGGGKDGWTRSYWDKFYEPEPKVPMKYLVEEPPTPAHTRMFVVDDHAAKEYRLFFMTEEAEETHFGR
jgi:hypothetical protein